MTVRRSPASVIAFVALALSLALVAVAGAPRDGSASSAQPLAAKLRIREYRLPAGKHPHDVAPAGTAALVHGPGIGRARAGSSPRTGGHGTSRSAPAPRRTASSSDLTGRRGSPTAASTRSSGVDPRSGRVRRFPLPASAGYANLNTATFDRRRILWFTGQSGIYGRLDPRTGKLRVFRAPRGEGPYGITTTPAGSVFYASLAGSYLGRINVRSARATVIRPPTRNQGARRAWSDSRGRIWISEWNAGKLGVYDPATRRWRERRLPGSNPMPYAVYVDERDIVWLTDFGSNALVRFDPRTARFTRLRIPTPVAEVRQLHGRRGQVWGAESGTDKLIVVHTR